MRLLNSKVEGYEELCKNPTLIVASSHFKHCGSVEVGSVVCSKMLYLLRHFESPNLKALFRVGVPVGGVRGIVIVTRCFSFVVCYYHLPRPYTTILPSNID